MARVLRLSLHLQQPHLLQLQQPEIPLQAAGVAAEQAQRAAALLQELVQALSAAHGLTTRRGHSTLPTLQASLRLPLPLQTRAALLRLRMGSQLLAATAAGSTQVVLAADLRSAVAVAPAGLREVQPGASPRSHGCGLLREAMQLLLRPPLRYI